MKEEGFDDPKDMLDEIEISSHSFAHFSSSLLSDAPPLRHHHMHALSHSQTSDEDQQSFPSIEDGNHSIEGTNESHRGNSGIVGNGTTIAMVHGIETEQRTSILSTNNHADSQISFTCPLPNYNEIYRSSSAVTVSNSFVSVSHGDRGTAWYEGDEGISDCEHVKEEMDKK